MGLYLYWTGTVRAQGRPAYYFVGGCNWNTNAHKHIYAGGLLAEREHESILCTPSLLQRVHKIRLNNWNGQPLPDGSTRHQARGPGSRRSGLHSPTCLSESTHRDCREKDHMGGCSREQVINGQVRDPQTENLLLMSIGTLRSQPFLQWLWGDRCQTPRGQPVVGIGRPSRGALIFTDCFAPCISNVLLLCMCLHVWT